MFFFLSRSHAAEVNRGAHKPPATKFLSSEKVSDSLKANVGGSKWKKQRDEGDSCRTGSPSSATLLQSPFVSYALTRAEVKERNVGKSVRKQ